MLTRTRLVEGNPKDCKGREAEGRSGSKGHTFAPADCATALGQLSTNAERTEGVPSLPRRRCCCSTAPPLPHSWKTRARGLYINTFSHPYRSRGQMHTVPKQLLFSPPQNEQCPHRGVREAHINYCHFLGRCRTGFFSEAVDSMKRRDTKRSAWQKEGSDEPGPRRNLEMH